VRLACGVSVLLFFAGANYRVDFRNVAAGAGLTERFPNGGDKSKRFILETTGSGAAFLDYDNDGLLDIFLVSGEGGVSRLYQRGPREILRRHDEDGSRGLRLGSGRLRGGLR